MSFTRYTGVLEVLAESPKGATVGQIQKLNNFMTRGQIERTLRDLIGEGFVRTEKVQYRPHIHSNIFHIEPRAAEYCGWVFSKYERTEHQTELPFVGMMPVTVEQLQAFPF